MHRSKIEWVLNPDNKTLGWIWNPITGCLNHTPDGLCLGGLFPCYAYKLAHGRLKERYLANKSYLNINLPIEAATKAQTLPCYDPFYPRFWPERINEPLYGDGKGIFVCDMSDLFGIGIPESWTASVLDVIKRSPHRFYLLTKQPQNLIKWNPFPENCWVGMTYTGKGQTEIGFGYHFEQIKAKVKFLSFEPLLARHPDADNWHLTFVRADISWLIIGAQTKPYKSPKIEWVQEIVKAADKAGIPVFLKNNLKSLLTKDEGLFLPIWAGKFNEGKMHFELRQEFPK